MLHACYTCSKTDFQPFFYTMALPVCVFRYLGSGYIGIWRPQLFVTAKRRLWSGILAPNLKNYHASTLWVPSFNLPVSPPPFTTAEGRKRATITEICRLYSDRSPRVSPPPSQDKCRAHNNYLASLIATLNSDQSSRRRLCPVGKTS